MKGETDMKVKTYQILQQKNPQIKETNKKLINKLMS